MLKNVLQLDAKAANKYFMEQQMYLTFDLPPYFKFADLLDQISKELTGKPISERQLEAAKRTENVNHIIYGNKGEKYSWRKLQLMNPLLYVSLVNSITDPVSWEIILKRFEELNNNKSIKCMSVPVLPVGDESQKASQIIEWIEEVERESIRLGLDFEFMFQTDITNCYGSIYTHSVSWAMHGKDEAKAKRGYEQLLGNRVDKHLQAMSYGQTNGIPQGSIIMNFIAEIVLAFADKLLSEKISILNISEDEYKILRFRDDYRIFVRNPHHGEIIMNALSEALSDLGMGLNSAKTSNSINIVTESIKADKFLSLHYPTLPIKSYHLLKKELLLIYELGTIYPNNGSILSRLNNINKNVSVKILQIQHLEIISILANIAFYNQRSFPLVAALTSRSLAKLGDDEKEAILKKLHRKFSLLPNLGLLEIWLQRITIKNNFKCTYKEKLCNLAEGRKVELFNISWNSNNNIKNIFKNTKIIDQKAMGKLNKIISKKEVSLFNPY